MTTYIERGFRLRREFTLADECVMFSGEQGGESHQRTIALGDLRPEPARSFARDTRVESVIAWISLVAILLLAIVPTLITPDRFPVENWLLVLYGTIAVVLLVICKYTLFPTRVEYVTFYSRAGVPVIGIGYRGGDKEPFETFVAAVVVAIEKAVADPKRTG